MIRRDDDREWLCNDSNENNGNVLDLVWKDIWLCPLSWWERVTILFDHRRKAPFLSINRLPQERNFDESACMASTIAKAKDFPLNDREGKRFFLQRFDMDGEFDINKCGLMYPRVECRWVYSKVPFTCDSFRFFFPNDFSLRVVTRAIDALCTAHDGIGARTTKFLWASDVMTRTPRIWRMISWRERVRRQGNSLFLSIFLHIQIHRYASQ
jgi:hypothetical protein